MDTLPGVEPLPALSVIVGAPVPPLIEVIPVNAGFNL